ncbi:hypothetical protein BFINE_06730 [Bacteroides finegoldii DSM 17565]|nr:hypothetical protein BFINE_06730 [Bacteroides finegoldii DSM 17565]
MNTYHFHPIIIDGSLTYATNGGINTGTVPPEVKIPILIVLFISQKLGDLVKLEDFNDYFRRKDRKKR